MRTLEMFHGKIMTYSRVEITIRHERSSSEKKQGKETVDNNQKMLHSKDTSREAEESSD